MIVVFSYQLLNNNSHLVFPDSVSGAVQEPFRALEPGGGVHQFDCGDELITADGKFRVVVRYHEGLIQAGGGMIVHIL